MEKTMGNAMEGSNFSLRDEIKAYWSARAATFDEQPGHEIFSEEERAAWQHLLTRHLGAGEGRKALDLASGTGVVSHLLDGIGFDVTGMDWAEPMLSLARAKAKRNARPIRFVMGDAENTMEPDESYDVITNRHLVWTLVDPKAAFAEWHRVLKPGGLFCFASDIDTYVNWTLRHCRDHGGFDWTAENAADWLTPFLGWPGTRYEAKAKREGRSSAYLTFRKI